MKTWTCEYEIRVEDTVVATGQVVVPAVSRYEATRKAAFWVHANDPHADARLDYTVEIRSATEDTP